MWVFRKIDGEEMGKIKKEKGRRKRRRREDMKIKIGKKRRIKMGRGEEERRTLRFFKSLLSINRKKSYFKLGSRKLIFH